jgi:signal transduction histidine kinase/CheY-like chemotaxis protein
MEQNKRILIVDDQQDLREQLAKLLLRSGKANETTSLVQQMRSRLLGIKKEEEENISDDDGYVCETVGQGEDAFEMVKKANAENVPYAVMFLDMRMPPGWDGLETAKKIREIDKNIEIVIMTAYADHDQSTIAETVGTPQKLLYIKKPFQSEEIYQLALSLTSKWNFEETERIRKNWLETLIRSMSKVKSIKTSKSEEVYSTTLGSFLTFTKAKKGFISVFDENQQPDKWKIEKVEGMELSEANDFIKEHSSTLYESRTTQNFDGKYLFPLKREGYSAVAVLYDVKAQNDPEWYKLLSLLSMTSSEVLSSVSTADKKAEQEQLSAVGVAIGKISHELKNQLGNLLGNASMLKEKLEGQEDNVKFANGIIQLTEDMLKQMNNILTFSDQKPLLNADKVNLKDIITECFDNYLTKDGIQIENNITGIDNAVINGCGILLKSLFSNLILNAANAAKSAGKDKIKIDISLKETPDKLILTFEDNGPGICSSLKGKNIFEPFISDGKGTGFGLGLAIAQQVVEKHQGKIRLDDEFTQGTRFIIEFPQA